MRIHAARTSTRCKAAGRSTTGWALLIVSTITIAVALRATSASGDLVTPQGAPTTFKPSIVNGTVTSAYPTTGALLIYDDASQSTFSTFCSGTLIGCQTFLTAAHCVCPDNTDRAETCQQHGLSDPSTLQVFLQHGGLFGVTRVAINPDYVFGQGGDLAVITLSEPVAGIAPSPLNILQQPAAGTAGTIVGFGSTNGGRNGVDDAGIKRDGAVAVGVCTGNLPPETNVCWNFLGPGANTCEGDSGGPLFVDFGSGAVLAGVTSGGGSLSCQAPDLPFDTDVFVYGSWIAGQAAGDVSSLACGSLPAVGTDSTAVLDSTGELSAAQPEAHWDFTVPADTRTLRITLNAPPWSGPGGETMNDFDLYVRAGSAPNASQYDCRDVNPTAFGFCEISTPVPGPWSVLVSRVSGSAPFQLTATTFAAPVSNSCAGDCNNDGSVTADELLIAVSIALGSMDITACRAGDLDGNGSISIDEILTAVSSALNDC